MTEKFKSSMVSRRNIFGLALAAIAVPAGVLVAPGAHAQGDPAPAADSTPPKKKSKTKSKAKKTKPTTATEPAAAPAATPK